MNVFKIAITTCVITGALFTRSAPAAWSYPVDAPVKPSLTTTKHLHNPSVQQIQNAIAPHTIVKVTGTVNASGGHRLSIDVNDVRLNFSQAQPINWSGNDTWAGFIEVSGSRVEILNMKMKVVSSGRCRGVVIHTPASDVRFKNCRFENIADGFIADGQWQRITLENTKFLNCSDWTSSTSMEGGYGFFLEDDDGESDHFRLINVTVTLAYNSGQHAIRVSNVQRMLIEDSYFGANAKRALWAYGIDYMTITGTTFDKGNVLFNLKTIEWQTERATRYVRMENCRIDHRSILTPLSIYCGKGSRFMRFRNIDITSTTSNKAMEIGWRGGDNRNIRWVDGSITFNGQTLHDYDNCAIGDFSDQDLVALKIGPM